MEHHRGNNWIPEEHETPQRYIKSSIKGNLYKLKRVECCPMAVEKRTSVAAKGASRTDMAKGPLSQAAKQ